MSFRGPPRDAEQEKALLRARLARLRSLRAALACPTSLAAQAVAAYSVMIDAAIGDAAVWAHREAHALVRFFFVCVCVCERERGGGLECSWVCCRVERAWASL